jgi:hypothetical protein
MVLVFKRFSFLSLFVLSRSMEMETGSQTGQFLRIMKVDGGEGRWDIN